MVEFIKDDVIGLLDFYIWTEMEKEKLFKEDQKTCQLKVCLYVNHNDQFQKDKLTVHTKLKQCQKISENNTGTDSDVFYIKSQKVSHRAPNTSADKPEHCHKTKIDTIVTKTHHNCETVFKTLIENTHGENRKKSQKSFTRETVRCQHSTEDKHTVHRTHSHISNENDAIHPHQVIPNEAADVQSGSKKLSRKSSGKAKKESTLKRSDSKITNKSVSNHGIKEANLSKSDFKTMNKDLSAPKEKKTILEKIKKKFSFGTKKRALSILSIYSAESVVSNRRKSIFVSNGFSTEDREMEREKPTNIITEICMDSTETTNFKIIKDDIAFIDEVDDDDITCKVLDDQDMEDDSYFHFDFSPEEFQQIESGETIDLCGCKNRRRETIIEYILLKLSGNFVEKDFQRTANFDFEIFHFNDCQLSPSYISPKTPRTNRKISKVPIESHRFIDSIIDKIKSDNEINCTMETINYFMGCNNYDSYEKGMADVLDTGISLENLILFFYLTRAIIKQTDDPTDPENEVIRYIMKFSHYYLMKHYIPKIKELGGMEKYISSQISSDVE